MRAIKAYNLNMGINRTDPNHYCYPMDLNSLEIGAQFLGDVFAQNNDLKMGELEEPLLSSEVTYSAFCSRMEQMANDALPGDYVFISLGTHGGKVQHSNLVNLSPQLTNGTDAWSFYDRMVFDIEMDALLTLFDEGVNICFLVDSCYADGIIPEKARIDCIENTYVTHRSDYEGYIVEALQKDRNIRANVAYITTGAKPTSDGSAGDYTAFLEQLKAALTDFPGANFSSLIEAINKRGLLSTQPKYFVKNNGTFFNAYKAFSYKHPNLSINTTPMAWNIDITEIRGRKVKLVITPDPSDSKAKRYVFDYEIVDKTPEPYTSTLVLKLHSNPAYDNGGSIVISGANSHFTACNGSCNTSNSRKCEYRVQYRGSQKTKKESQNKVSDQIGNEIGSDEK